MSNVHSRLSNVEFTLRWYREFIETLRDDGYRFCSFQESIEDNSVFLRHDVDLSIGDALEMARLESDVGVTSTYFLLLASPLYNPFETDQQERIREISALGHDIGLHFSTHQYWLKERPPSSETLHDRINEERTVLDTMLDTEIVSTVSFHIPPDWVLNRSFPGIKSTYEPAIFSDIEYIADSGQRWRHDPPTMVHKPFQLLTHPGLWSDRDAPFEQRIEEAVEDAVMRTRLLTHSEFIEGVYS